MRSGHSPGVLYVCGVPGTGKTAIISQVVKDVMQQQQQQQCQRQQQQLQKQLGSPHKGALGFAGAPGMQVVSLNALSLPSPMHVYSKVRCAWLAKSVWSKVMRGWHLSGVSERLAVAHARVL